MDRLDWGERESFTWFYQASSLHPATHLSHLDELDEDFSSELGGGAAENHQLYPLGDAVAQSNGPLHGGVLLHATIHKVILIIRELGKKKLIRTVLQHSWRSEGHATSAELMTRSCWGTEELLSLLFFPADKDGRKDILLILPTACPSTSEAIRHKWMCTHTS